MRERLAYENAICNHLGIYLLSMMLCAKVWRVDSRVEIALTRLIAARAIIDSRSEIKIDCSSWHHNDVMSYAIKYPDCNQRVEPRHPGYALEGECDRKWCRKPLFRGRVIASMFMLWLTRPNSLASNNVLPGALASRLSVDCMKARAAGCSG